METIKDRLLAFIEYKKISVRKFEMTTGVSNGYVKNLKATPSGSVIDRICEEYPELNMTWLLSGSGRMINGNEEKTSSVSVEKTNRIPLLSMSAVGVELSEFLSRTEHSSSEQMICPIESAEVAVTVCGDSMAPDYPNGAIVYIKKIDETSFIEWGTEFVIDTCNGNILKRLVPGSTDDSVKCYSSNEQYPPFEIKKEDIKGIYRVLGCLILK